MDKDLSIMNFTMPDRIYGNFTKDASKTLSSSETTQLAKNKHLSSAEEFQSTRYT
ncbi:hypothetical protein EDE15_2730 [Edaphobacter aggregans]|uniref:Uncharacterized protein n=1 Tax=Edaphobacter aggregans TaxID=570835 RepID=A0A428MK13_9BACT|nr:hypothetical protein EDE15_2730 [Edaphobacter aggregans]